MRIAGPALLVMTFACTEAGPPARADADDGLREQTERVLDGALDRFTALADSIDALLVPVPLLSPAEENALRSRGNAQHLERARALGARPADSTEVARWIEEGRLVRLEDTAHWVVGRMGYAAPVVTADTHALLVRIAERFQERLADMGLPPYRIEITSALRTAEAQAALRRANPNAAAGTSVHEYGTTVDIAYFAFAAPADIDHGVDVDDLAWLEPRLDRIAAAWMEAAAGRKSRELQAILGRILIELQRADDVLVTMERQQPVYHITVGRRLAD